MFYNYIPWGNGTWKIDESPPSLEVATVGLVREFEYTIATRALQQIFSSDQNTMAARPSQSSCWTPFVGWDERHAR